MEHEDLVGLASGFDTVVTAWTCETAESLKPAAFLSLRRIVDDFGHKSAVAQGLPAPVTDLGRLRSSTHILYLAARRAPGSNRALIIGGLKTGRKRLFVQEGGPFIQIEPLCVLDFYVHESYQRQGVGYQLFEHFLHAESQVPAALAYDRPSPKLLGFLDKYFGLNTFVPQNNNFVVFRNYWETSLDPLQPAPQTGKAACISKSPARTTDDPVPLLSRHISNLQEQVSQMDSRAGATCDAPNNSPAICGGNLHVGGRHHSTDENSLTGSGSMLVSAALSRAAADCSMGSAGHRTLAASHVAAMTGAPASVCAADSSAAETGLGQGFGAALDDCHLHSAGSGGLLPSQQAQVQQQKAHKCFAVVPPWAVHVPLKRGPMRERAV